MALSGKRIAELLAIGQVRTRTHGVVSVLSAAGGVPVLPHNPARVRWLLVNKGANQIHVTRRPNPTTGTGAVADPDGGNVGEKWADVGEVCQGEVHAIAETANTDAFVYELEVFE